MDSPETTQPTRTPSRRDFLRGAAVTAAAGGLVGCADAQTAPAAATAKLTDKVIRGAVVAPLQVNGQTIEVVVEPRTTLLDALRDGETPAGQDVDHTGAKRVCDRGTCGACSVLLDGKLVYACSVLALDAVGKPIRTVEGLAAGGKLSVVQEEFVKHDGLMCGFCTPGFVMAATALLEQNNNPTRAQIQGALDGNLCRCGTYHRVFEAVDAAAERLRKGAR
ncbi:MAG: (2Fe-2S)-binding protein [Fimbriimonadaceae bacterium]|nr:(2Fe-2S)-binding protein [Fimbriimonadaceae bacterium]